MEQKVRVSNCICILNNSIFVKFQPLNKNSKSAKKKMWLSKDGLYIQGWIIAKLKLQKTQEQNGMI